MHEIITVQLGQRANYLATHFWNTQESYFTYSEDQESPVDHDIHFRPGIGADGSETFTPRTVIYDLKGGFGNLRKLNALYELEEEGVPQPLWNGPTIIQRQSRIEQNAYQTSLDSGLPPSHLTTSSVRYWSDFNRVFYHPRSIVQLNDYELNSSLMPFEKWDAGGDLFDELDKEHDLLDRDLRPFVEEADQMQGIQMLASIDDAWGGFAARYMDRLRDEYGKTSIWVWGSEDATNAIPRDKQFLKLSNTAHSLVEIASSASLFIPCTLPSSPPSYLNLDKYSLWHTSALFSTAHESMTLPSRLRPVQGLRHSLDELAAPLNVNGNQNIVRLQMSLGKMQAQGNGDMPSTDTWEPSSGLHGTNHDVRMPSMNGQIATLDEEDGDNGDESIPLDMDFSPAEIPQSGRRARSEARVHLFGRAEALRGHDVHATNRLSEVDGQERARRRAAGLAIIHKTSTSLSFPLLSSFPSIYATAPGTDALEVRTTLSTDTAVALRIKNLRSVVGRGIGVEEREALINSLGELAEAYEEGWSSGSDEDDD